MSLLSIVFVNYSELSLEDKRRKTDKAYIPKHAVYTQSVCDV